MPESNGGSASAWIADAKVVSAIRLVFIESIIFISNTIGVLDSFAFYGEQRGVLDKCPGLPHEVWPERWGTCN